MADSDFGKRLQQARTAAHLKQQEVCDRLGIAKTQTLSSYERGVNNPPIRILAGLAELYKVSIDWIVLGDTPLQIKQKSTSEYVTDFFIAMDKLGLEISAEREAYSNNLLDSYVIYLKNDKLRQFNVIVRKVYKLSDARSSLEAEEYDMLVRNRVNECARESNDFEEIPQEEIDEKLREEENNMPF